MFKRNAVQKIKFFLKSAGGKIDISKLYVFIREKDLIDCDIKSFEVIHALIKKGHIELDVMEQDIILLDRNKGIQS